MSVRGIVAAGVAAVVVFGGVTRAEAQEVPVDVGAGSPVAPQSATVYRTGFGGGLFGGGSGDGSKRREIIVAGVITLGVAYGASVLGAILGKQLEMNVLLSDFTTIEPDGFGARQALDNLYIPVIGPWIGLSENMSALELCQQFALACSEEDYWMGNVGYIAAGVAQATGVVIIVVGLMQKGPSAKTDSTHRVILSGSPLPGGGLVTVGGGF